MRCAEGNSAFRTCRVAALVSIVGVILSITPSLFSWFAYKNDNWRSFHRIGKWPNRSGYYYITTSNKSVLSDLYCTYRIESPHIESTSGDHGSFLIEVPDYVREPVNESEVCIAGLGVPWTWICVRSSTSNSGTIFSIEVLWTWLLPSILCPTAVVVTIYYCTRVGVRSLRRRRSLCIYCGYPIAPQCEQCTECGLLTRPQPKKTGGM